MKNVFHYKKKISTFTILLISFFLVTSAIHQLSFQMNKNQDEYFVLSCDNTPDRAAVGSLMSEHPSLDETKPMTENGQMFDLILDSLMSLGHISGLSAVAVQDDEVVWSQGYGLYDRENLKQTTPETIFLVASISKTFTATAVMQLVEQGLIDLDDDINSYLNFSVRNPGYPNDNITIRMLLAHQSSIARDLDTSWTRMIPGDLTITGYPYPYLKDFFIPGGIHYKPQFWMDYPPGEDMIYSNSGFALLGYLVERVTGQSFAKYCKEHIFHPLGMNNTSFRFTDLNSSNVAVPYEYLGVYSPYLHYQILDYPAGGLRTTTLDLSRFLIAHMNDGSYENIPILNATSVEQMHTIQYESDTYNFQYGLGFQIWETKTGQIVGHTGGLSGVATKMLYRPTEDLSIIIFANKAITNQRERIFFSLIEQLLWLKAQKENPKSQFTSSLFDIFRLNQYLSENY